MRIRLLNSRRMNFHIKIHNDKFSVYSITQKSKRSITKPFKQHFKVSWDSNTERDTL